MLFCLCNQQDAVKKVANFFNGLSGKVFRLWRNKLSAASTKQNAPLSTESGAYYFMKK
jgi:hypothetical protein